jgi:hypothetical protein
MGLLAKIKMTSVLNLVEADIAAVRMRQPNATDTQFMDNPFHCPVNNYSVTKPALRNTIWPSEPSIFLCHPETCYSLILLVATFTFCLVDKGKDACSG